MNRIADPLSKMDARIKTTNGTLPITIEGNSLMPACIELKIPSAQIKSGIMLASLNTKGQTIHKSNTMIQIIYKF